MGMQNFLTNLNRYGTEYQKHLDGTMCNLADHWAVEWPARSAYWKQAESFFERLDHPGHTSYVDGCAAGLLGNDGLPIAKRWRVMVTHQGHEWSEFFSVRQVARPLSPFRTSSNTTLSGDTV